MVAAVQGNRDAVQLSSSAASYRRRVLFLVAFMGLIFFFEAGIESGVSPSAVPGQRAALNATVTAVASAQAAAEVTKIAGSIFVAVFTTSASVQASVVAAGALVFTLGCVVISLAESIFVLAIGFLCLGLGYSFILVLCAPILESYVVLRGDRDKIAFYLSLAYCGSGLGVAMGYVVAGQMPDAWRGLYLVCAACLGVTLAGFVFCDRSVASSLAALPHADRDPTFLAVTDDAGDAAAAATVSTPTTPQRRRGVMMPVSRLLLHSKLLLHTPAFVWTVAGQTAMLFYITAYIILLPTYLQDALHQSAGDVGVVMGATVPATVLGMVCGGWLVKHFAMGLREQLRLVALTCAASLPLALGFIIADSSVLIFTLFLFFGMLVIFMNSGPSRTVLPLMIDHSGLAVKLCAIVSDDDSLQLHTAREVLVAHANALSNLGVRLFGSVPGPIFLAFLLDSGVAPATAFALVGVFGMVISAACAYMAFRSVVEAVGSPQTNSALHGDQNAGAEELEVAKQDLVDR